MKQKRALVLGAGGFIGNHLVTRLKSRDYYVVGIDLKLPEFSSSLADNFDILDLRNEDTCYSIFDEEFDEVYQLAANMGGAGFIFTGENDADIMRSSALINHHIVHNALASVSGKVFYSSSACVYPAYLQDLPNNPGLKEDMAYPANPDSEYGWEKLFSERLYQAYNRNRGLDIRIARFHNIYGPDGAYKGGREKAPAAICRKVAEAHDNSVIEIWGDGKQTRSFLYIEDCLDGIEALMGSNYVGPLNIGSEEQVSINELTDLVISLSGKKLTVKHISGPLGVRGRNSNNDLVTEKTGWKPKTTLREGMKVTYDWINHMVNK